MTLDKQKLPLQIVCALLLAAVAMAWDARSNLVTKEDLEAVANSQKALAASVSTEFLRRDVFDAQMSQVRAEQQTGNAVLVGRIDVFDSRLQAVMQSLERIERQATVAAGGIR